MKTKITKELLKELGWKYKKETKSWYYPDFNTKHGFIDGSYLTEDTPKQFYLKDVIGFMVNEQRYRILQEVIKSIKQVVFWEGK